MTTTRLGAGLTWTLDGDAWVADDAAGTYKVVEWAPGQWMEMFWPREDGCGCGAPPAGGRDWPSFEVAVTRAVALGHASGET